MIAYLEGEAKHISESGCMFLTSGGVGYEVFLTNGGVSELSCASGTIGIFIHTVVREDAITLYGFPAIDERDFFRMLISIDKLGPKKALAILSYFTPEKLREISFREDAAALATVPGIGPKSSKQILWHMKDKVKKMGALTSTSKKGKDAECPPVAENGFMDALSALTNLGYSEDEARPLLIEAFEKEPDLDTSTAIRLILKTIAAAKS
ncbi:MAG: Holliday junction branch migration protein RuvA [Desulfovibrio sp.]